MKISKNTDIIKKYIKDLNLTHIFDDNLLSMLSLHSFAASEVLFNSEDNVENLYVLLDGQAGIVPLSEKGKLSLLDIIILGDVIGDIEYFNDDNYYYQVRALSPCTLLAIPVNSIDLYFQHNSQFYKYICRNLAQKMKRTSFKYARTLLYPLKNRLAKFLYELSKIHGNKIPDVQSNQTADYLGISLRHLRRVLAELEQEGILIRENAAVTVIDINKLQQKASYK
ncbi:cyclic nucleotide-binding domain-containing protein [Clostridium sp. 'deep sea']|uniref:Crp/Fnr family transcriptional regulator n=1 Tax=Clostridium sp. 'deep sea' TaxID=2779445 RepID=UPI00189667AF|nr:cyclic nucleotide-binding domain-containing protein [Clostridium sp. 'deep sea']QOR35242.1 cyclic nucleotide-binding domain-containing protein [Clostridium sp. 'deep sea']